MTHDSKDRPMPAAQQMARVFAHLGFTEAEVEQTLRERFPGAPIDELVDEAFAHKDHVDAELELG